MLDDFSVESGHVEPEWASPKDQDRLLFGSQICQLRSQKSSEGIPKLLLRLTCLLSFPSRSWIERVSKQCTKNVLSKGYLRDRSIEPTSVCESHVPERKFNLAPRRMLKSRLWSISKSTRASSRTFTSLPTTATSPEAAQEESPDSKYDLQEVARRKRKTEWKRRQGVSNPILFILFISKLYLGPIVLGSLNCACTGGKRW